MGSIDRSGTRWSKVVVTWLALVVLVGVASGTAAAGPGNSGNAHLCQRGGWMNLVGSDGKGFSNAGACTSYAARGGTLMPASPYPEAKALCESLGGTFGVGGPVLTGVVVPDHHPEIREVLWVCNGWVSADGSAEERFLFDPLCVADAGGLSTTVPWGSAAFSSRFNLTCGIRY